MAIYGSDLVVSGEFEYAGGGTTALPALNIARWDGTAWHRLDGGLDEPAEAMIEHDGRLVASGWFTRSGSDLLGHVARWNGISWRPFWSNLERAARFVRLDGELYAAGWLYADSAPRVLRWDGSTWIPLGELPLHGPKPALATWRGRLVAAVVPPAAGRGCDCVRIATWDGAAWQLLGDRSFARVYDLVELGGDLVAGGRFEPGHNLARWNGEAWSSLGTGVHSSWSAFVTTLVVHGGRLHVMGNFQTAGRRASQNIARWDEIITPVTLEEFTAVREADGVRLAWRVQTPGGSTAGVHVQRAAAAVGPYIELNDAPLPAHGSMLDAAAGAAVWYRLRLVDDGGGDSTTRPIAVEDVPGPDAPASFDVPYDPGGGRPIELRYRLAEPCSRVRLRIYDVAGRSIRAFEEGARAHGAHSAAWDRRDARGHPVRRGLYLVRFEAGGREIVRKLVLLAAR
jgi:hypothetical protein